MTRFACLTVGVVLFAISSLYAAEAKPKVLFNGRNLDGWIVTDCKVEVVDGCLFLKDGNGFVRTPDKYKDYVLVVEYKPEQKEKYDSGVYFRCGLPPENSSRKWPTKYQINLKDGDECNLVGAKEGGKSTGLVKPGEWNTFRATVKGSTIEMEINGKPAWKADGLENPDGYIGLQAEVPGGGQFRFRKVEITELP